MLKLQLLLVLILPQTYATATAASSFKELEPLHIHCREDYQTHSSTMDHYKKQKKSSNFTYWSLLDKAPLSKDLNNHPLPGDKVSFYSLGTDQTDGEELVRGYIDEVEIHSGSCQCVVTEVVSENSALLRENKLAEASVKTKFKAHPTRFVKTSVDFPDTVGKQPFSIKEDMTAAGVFNSLYLDSVEAFPHEAHQAYLPALIKAFCQYSKDNNLSYYPTSSRENLCGYFALIEFAKKTNQYHKIVSQEYIQNFILQGNLHPEDSFKVAKALSSENSGEYIDTANLGALARSLDISLSSEESEESEEHISFFHYSNTEEGTENGAHSHAPDAPKNDLFILCVQGHYVLAKKQSSRANMEEASMAGGAGGGAAAASSSHAHQKRKASSLDATEDAVAFEVDQSTKDKTRLLECHRFSCLKSLSASGLKLDTQKRRMDSTKKTTDKFHLPTVDLTDNRTLDDPRFISLCQSLGVNLGSWKQILCNPQNSTSWEQLDNKSTDFSPGNKVLIQNDGKTIGEATVITADPTQGTFKLFINKSFDSNIEETFISEFPKDFPENTVVVPEPDTLHTIMRLFPLDAAKESLGKLDLCPEFCGRIKEETTLFEYLKEVYVNCKKPTQISDGEVIYFNEILQTLFISFVKMLEAAQAGDKICLNTILPTHHLLQGYCPFPSWIIPLVYKIKNSEAGEQIILIDDDINFGDSFVLLNSPEFQSLLAEHSIEVFVVQIYDPRVWPFSSNNPGDIRKIESLLQASEKIKFVLYDMASNKPGDNISTKFNDLLEKKGFVSQNKTHVIHLCGFDNHIEEQGFAQELNDGGEFVTNTYYKTWFTSEQRKDLVHWLTSFENRGFYLFSLEGGYQESTLGTLLEETLEILLKASPITRSMIDKSLRDLSQEDFERAQKAADASKAKEESARKKARAQEDEDDDKKMEQGDADGSSAEDDDPEDED